MKKRYAVCGAAVVWMLGSPANQAGAQVVILDSTRTLGSSVVGGIGTGQTIGTVVVSQSDPISSASLGSFSNTSNTQINYLDTNQPQYSNGSTTNYPDYLGTASAEQTSVVTPTLLSATGNYGSFEMINNNGDTDLLTHSVSSSYVVDFYVTQPTPLSLTGEVQADYVYTLGSLPSPQTTFTLTSSLSSTPIYTVTAMPFDFQNDPNISLPLSYQGMLEPGQTYTLSMVGEATGVWGVDDPGESQDNGTFNFTATVPEPAGMLIPLAGAALLRRRSRL